MFADTEESHAEPENSDRHTKYREIQTRYYSHDSYHLLTSHLSKLLVDLVSGGEESRTEPSSAKGAAPSVAGSIVPGTPKQGITHMIRITY